MDSILVFGGGFNRVEAGLKLAQTLPNSRIIISAFKRSEVMAAAKQFGINSKRITLHYQGLDTLGEIVTTLPIVKRFKAKQLHLVSDHWHLPRIRVAANIVYCFQGIQLIPAPVYDGKDRVESRGMVNIDRARALLWKGTGILQYSPDVRARANSIKALAGQ
jgi:uncharacterized SAM-binding protein YcdF (DUF218 family)